MKLGATIPVAVLAAALADCGGGGNTPVASPPVPPPAIAPAGLGTNALERIARLVALGPRDSCTTGALVAAGWIASELGAMGLVPHTDAFDDPLPDGTPRQFHNVVASLGEGTPRVLLLSHYDTKAGIGEGFAGANDGGSSTGLLLALAEHYAAHPFAGTLVFAFLDGEECKVAYSEHDGLHGSRRLAAKSRTAGERYDAVILLDMVGDRDLKLTLPRNGDKRLKSILLDAAAAQGVRDRVRLLPYDMLDDHSPFHEAGYPAIDLIDFEFGACPGLNNYWHTAEDTVDKLSPDTLRTVGGIVMEMLQRIR